MIKKCPVSFREASYRRDFKRPTVWLSGSGGTGETRLNDCAFSGKPRSAKKRRSRCPLELMLGAFCSCFSKQLLDAVLGATNQSFVKLPENHLRQLRRLLGRYVLRYALPVVVQEHVLIRPFLDRMGGFVQQVADLPIAFAFGVALAVARVEQHHPIDVVGRLA